MKSGRLFPASTPLEILKVRLLDTATLNHCRELSHKFLKQGLGNRAFNDFPILISDKLLDEKASQLKNILLTLCNCKLTSNKNLRILPIKIQDELTAIIIEIALLGYKSFVKNDAIHPELINLLEWQEFTSKLEIRQLIFSFTAETFAQIMQKSQAILGNSLDFAAYSAVMNYTNENYGNCVSKALHKSIQQPSDDVTYIPAPAFEPQNNLHRPNYAPLAAAALGTGFFIVGGITFAVMMADQYDSQSYRRNGK